jgi:hypothetical protein
MPCPNGASPAGPFSPSAIRQRAHHNPTFCKTRRPRSKVEAEIEAITRKPWVRRVVTWQLGGEKPRDLRLAWGIDQTARAALDEELTVLIYPSAGGRPKARRMTTELTGGQQKLYEIFELGTWAPLS